VSDLNYLRLVRCGTENVVIEKLIGKPYPKIIENFEFSSLTIQIMRIKA